jgi:hypothetical protein
VVESDDVVEDDILLGEATLAKLGATRQVGDEIAAETDIEPPVAEDEDE